MTVEDLTYNALVAACLLVFVAAAAGLATREWLRERAARARFAATCEELLERMEREGVKAGSVTRTTIETGLISTGTIRADTIVVGAAAFGPAPFDPQDGVATFGPAPFDPQDGVATFDNGKA